MYYVYHKNIYFAVQSRRANVHIINFFFHNIVNEFQDYSYKSELSDGKFLLIYVNIICTWVKLKFKCEIEIKFCKYHISVA